LKIYNKSKQYKKDFDIKEHILRVELKLTSKRKIQSFGINSLNDLLDRDKLFKMFEFLKNEFKKLTIIDTLNFDDLPDKDRDKLNRYSNPNYWQRLRNENKSYKVQERLKKDFNFTLEKYNLTTIKKELESKLIEKFYYLINENESELIEPKNGLGIE